MSHPQKDDGGSGCLAQWRICGGWGPICNWLAACQTRFMSGATDALCSDYAVVSAWYLSGQVTDCSEPGPPLQLPENSTPSTFPTNPHGTQQTHRSHPDRTSTQAQLDHARHIFAGWRFVAAVSGGAAGLRAAAGGADALGLSVGLAADVVVCGPGLGHSQAAASGRKARKQANRGSQPD